MMDWPTCPIAIVIFISHATPDDNEFVRWLGELPIQIHQLNTIDFTSGWGGRLADLVDTLTKADVPRVVTDLTAEFDCWRQASIRSDVVVERGEESLLTSILPIVRLPEEISFYEYEGENRKFEEAVKTVPHPIAWHNRLLVSFAAAHELQEHLPVEFTVALRANAPFPAFLEGALTDPIGPIGANAALDCLRPCRHDTRHIFRHRSPRLGRARRCRVAARRRPARC
jgi:hypothetical protein